MAVKEEIVAFLRKTFANEKYPGRFRLDFICQGDRQFEKVSEACAKRFKDLLIERGYEVSGNIADMTGEGNIYFYLGWGNFTYAHMALFSRDVCEKFTDALIEFSADEGELEIKGEIIILNFNR